MSNYKGAILRLGILCVLLVGMLSLAPRAQALFCDPDCVACKQQCWSDYHQCVGEGLEGCDSILIDCLDGCNSL